MNTCSQDTTVACDKELEMNRITTALLAIALSVPALAMAQSSSSQQQDNGQVQQEQSNQAAMNSVSGMNTSAHKTMTGMVTDNGKRFTSDNVSYQVSNPDSLKNYDNQNVTVNVQFNTTKNTIKVDKVNPGQ
jgi:hypothetical protein